MGSTSSSNGKGKGRGKEIHGGDGDDNGRVFSNDDSVWKYFPFTPPHDPCGVGLGFPCST